MTRNEQLTREFFASKRFGKQLNKRKKARDARFGTPSKTDHTQRHERKQRIRYT